MLKMIEDKTYIELRDYMIFILDSFILKENDNHTSDVLNNIKERVIKYDNNIIII